MPQKMEALRLFPCSQISDSSNDLISGFVEEYDPLGPPMRIEP